MRTISENSWPQGWNPSSSDQNDLGRSNSLELLVLDNLTLDDQGMVRIAKKCTDQSDSSYTNIRSLESAYFGTGATLKKMRYFYENGYLLRNYGANSALGIFDKTIFSGSIEDRAYFLKIFGHVLAFSGVKKYKDHGDVQWPLGIPAPATPTISAGVAIVTDVANLDGSLEWTNWSFDYGSGILANTSATLNAPFAGISTTYSSALDLTEFNGITGQDAPSDRFILEINFDHPENLNSNDLIGTCIRFDIDATNLFTAAVPLANLVQGNNFIEIPRSAFNRYGSDYTLGWEHIIKATIWITCHPGAGTTSIIGSIKLFSSAHINKTYQYALVDVRNTGEYLEFSLASSPTIKITSGTNAVVISPVGAVNSQANEQWLFRYSETTGVWLFVDKQVSTEGFTPTDYTDILSDDYLLERASEDPLYTMEYYRTALPDNIRGGIVYADRAIYLTETSFIPSFKNDPGSYDSRFVYEVASSSAEKCLFIAKLDVGTFIVATTKDFYRVTGTFSTQDITGTGVISQDVNIYALGVSQPSISEAFVEYEGTILYISSTGLRELNGGASTIIHGPLELLFRNETRYGVPPISLLAQNTGQYAIVTTGNRIIYSLPCSDGNNYVFVLTKVGASGYWRRWTLEDASLNPQIFCKEEDGTILLGSYGSAPLRSFEDTDIGYLPVRLRTKYNFGGLPTNRKDILDYNISLDTGNVDVSLVTYTIDIDGTISTVSTTLAASSEIVSIQDAIPTSLAYSVDIFGTVQDFYLAYFLFNYQERPTTVKKMILYGTNFGYPNKKKLAAIPFSTNLLGTAMTIYPYIDGIAKTPQTLTADTGIKTYFWRNDEDLVGTDYELVLLSDGEMEFYKFYAPEILQIFPQGKFVDQFGPLDLALSGQVFALRLRLFAEGSSVDYIIYDCDVPLLLGTLVTTPNVDLPYIISLPNGVNADVLKAFMNSTDLFYRFSIEALVRTTGKETENKWVKLKDKHA